MIKKIKPYTFVICLYLFSLTIFFIQHSSGLSWDFCAYVLNARYYLSGFKTYFEPLRPPLASILMIFLSEYPYIVFVSFIHLFSCYKLCKRYKLNLNLFYAVSLTPYFLVTSFFAGTELLSLSLIQLFVAYFDDDKKAGFFLGLAALTRYTNISYFIAILFKRKLKPAIYVFLIASLTIAPWLLFNFFKFGDPLFSIIDQYANNIGFRGYLWKMPGPFEFLEFWSYLLIPLPIGLFLTFKKPKKISTIDLVLLFSLIFEIYSFIRIPLRTSRYLFVAILPTAYFITKAFQSYEWANKILPPSLFFFFFIFLPLYSAYLDFVDANIYASALKDLDNCMVSSNAWVYVNYLGVKAEPYPHENLINKRINEGYRLLFFKNVGEPAYVFNSSFMRKFNILNETKNYYLLGNLSLCKEPYGYDLSYVQGLNRTYMEVYGHGISYTIFDILK